MHKYNNQDHSMMTALLAARNILGLGRYDTWKVNTDAEYHEEGSEQGAPHPRASGTATSERSLKSKRSRLLPSSRRPPTGSAS